jgi:hypothetical protein
MSVESKFRSQINPPKYRFIKKILHIYHLSGCVIRVGDCICSFNKYSNYDIIKCNVSHGRIHLLRGHRLSTSSFHCPIRLCPTINMLSNPNWIYLYLHKPPKQTSIILYYTYVSSNQTAQRPVVWHDVYLYELYLKLDRNLVIQMHLQNWHRSDV